MADNSFVIAGFEFVDDTQKAIAQLRDKGFNDIELFSPLPNHDLEDEMYKGKRRSPVRMCTLIGATTGCLGAFLFTSWMSIDYPIRTSAKPLMSIPAFVIIAFECTILLGAISTLLGMGFFSRVPNIFQNNSHRPEFTNNRFGVSVKVDKSKSAEVEDMLLGLGAEKTEVANA